MAMLRNEYRSSGILWCFVASCVLALAGSFSYAQTKNSCLDCHSVLPKPLEVTQETFSHDIHAQKGLTCVSCHGGNASSDDPEKAMSRAAGWKGSVSRQQIPQLCGSCHSNPAYMRRFNPSLRTDQLAEYHTSVHGKRLATGDTNVAVCTDCHGVHDLRAPNDPQSKVYPVNIASTCARCHADANYMKKYSIPTDQFVKYNASVHHEALVSRGDLSAPTCTTCHGNHGATPPGVDSVPNVCSTCHVFQAQMYKESTHKAVFDAASLPGCVVCHENHAILHPTDAKLSDRPGSTCIQCHTPGDACDQARAKMLGELTQLDGAIRKADQQLALAEAAGMEVGEARLAQNDAKDSLTKARVAIHSFKPEVVSPLVQTGLAIANKDLQAGKNAMIERNHRRIGLGLSFFAIGIMVVGLWLFIKKIEH
jgi:hypothetical protein